MKLRIRPAVVALCLAMFGLGVVGYAQVLMTQPVPPMVLAGPDVGFRVEGMRGGTPVGTIVVRVNGRWVEADFGMGPMSLGTR